MLRFHSLRARIITWSFVPTTIILFAVALTTFWAYQQVTEDLTLGRNRELTRLSASKLSTDLNRYPQILQGLANTGPFRSNSPAVQQQALTEASNKLVVFDGGVVILDAHGNVAASEPKRSDIAREDWSNRAYFRQLIRSTEPIFSDVVPDGPGGSQVIVVAVPITGDNAEFQGAIAGMFRLGTKTISTFYGGIIKLRIVEEGVTYIVDANGKALYDSEGLLTGKDVSDQEAVRQVMSKRVGEMRISGGPKGDVFAAYSPIPGTSWGLVTQETWSALMASSQGYRQALLVLLALGVVLPTAVVTFGVRRVTDPIEKLTKGSKEVASGNFEHSIDVETGDELEELAKQFNLMATQLRESYSGLESKVADRTKELATINAISAVVNQSLDLEEVLNDAMDKTIELTNMDAGAAYSLDSEKNMMVMVSHKGLSETFVHFTSEVDVNDGTLGIAGRMMKPYSQKTADYGESQRKRILESEGIEMVVSIPIVFKGKLLGAINIVSRQWRQLSDEEYSLLGAVGQQIGVAVANALLYEQAEEVAATAERSRLARDLHDAVTQTLFSASLIADVLPRIYARSPEDGARKAEELKQLTRGALAEMRTLLLELRPSALLEASLEDLMRQLAEAIYGRSRIPVGLKLDCQCDLPADVKVAFYRIAQEALNNVVKHSGAYNAALEMSCWPGFAELIVADDGKGFDCCPVSSDHFGLRIMRERAEAVAADISFDSAVGVGTRVILTWQEVKEVEEQ